MPTLEEIAVDGLLWRREAAIIIKDAGHMGRGVFATADIPSNTFICEYKTGSVLTPSKVCGQIHFQMPYSRGVHRNKRKL